MILIQSRSPMRKASRWYHGEILVKFLPANSHLLRSSGEQRQNRLFGSYRLSAAAIQPRISRLKSLDSRNPRQPSQNLGLRAIDWLRKTAANEALEQVPLYTVPDIRDLCKMAAPIVSAGNQTGEMVPDRRDDGTHPWQYPEHRLHPAFWMPASSHRARKSVIKEVRREHPEANIIVTIDRSGCQRSKSAEQDQNMLSRSTEESA